MADNSFDLRCSEAESFCFDDFVSQIEKENNGFVIGSDHSNGSAQLDREESFYVMYERETLYFPINDYLSRLRSGALDLGFRREALDWIWKAHSHYSFGPLSFCLSINYLDRFLSIFDLPIGKTWAVQLLAVACFSIATKLVETTMPLTVYLQVGEPKFVFEGKIIQRMELLVLSTLNWKIQACTPFAFIDYFLRKINEDIHLSSMSLVSRSIQLILSTVKGIEFLEFRSSEIAAAVAISASIVATELDIDQAVSSFNHLEKGRVVKCLQLIKDLKLVGGPHNLPLAPKSPIGILDAANCLSHKSSDDLTTANSSPITPTQETKKRKSDTSSSQEEDFMP